MRPYRFAPDRFEQQGWQGQFARMERWHRRALDALDSSQGGHLGDSEDFIYAFCQAAYHLRDWLQKSGAASQAELDALMASTPALKLCRDVCNGSKHFSLDPSRTETNHIGLMREYVPPIGTPGPGSSRPRILVFEGQDGAVEMVEIRDLMKECVETWSRFCDLLPPSDT
jgi:hypothetical protein